MVSPLDKRNITLYAVGEGVWGLHAAMIATGTVFTVMLRDFGAGKMMLGSLLAIEMGTVLLLQFLGLYVFASRRKRRRHLMLWHIFAMTPFWLLIAGTVFFHAQMPQAVVRWTILLCFAGFYSAVGIVIASWSDWIAHIFTVKIRGLAMGLSFGASALAGTLGAFVAGWMVEKMPSPQVYAWIFAVAGMLTLFSMAFYWFMRDPAEDLPHDPPRAPTTVVLERVRASLRDFNFRQYLVGRALVTAGFCLAPLITVYFLSEAGGSIAKSNVVWYGAAATIGMAIASVVLGRLGDLRGHRVGVLTGAAAQVATLLIVLFARGDLACVAAFALMGVANGAGNVAHHNMLFETCPHDNRFAHITIGNFVVGVVGIAASLLSGVAAAQWGFKPLFWVCLALSVAGLAWFVAFVKDPRDVEIIR
jgi:MFS family permease